MSDLEDDRPFQNGSSERGDDHDGRYPSAYDDNDHHERSHTHSRGRDADEEEEEEEEEPQRRLYEDDEEEDEDDEEEEEEEGGAEEGGRPKKKTKRRKKAGFNRFLDIEAEVDEEDEEDDEDEDLGAETFIAGPELEGDDDDIPSRLQRHLELDRQQGGEENLEEIAERYRKQQRRTAAAKYTGDMNEIPQRLLMPSVQDASLWQVRVKPGKERDLVFSLMRKSIDKEFGVNAIDILSVFQRDSLPGMIYVEARSAAQVQKACNGLVGIYPSRGVNLVPIDEMASLLQIKKKEVTVTPGSWVRIKRGKYMGDLAQVVDITENGEEVGLKFVPRIDLNPKEESTADGKKRKKVGGAPTSLTARPAQRFFNSEEVIKVYGRKAVSKRNQVYVFQGDTYKDGFIEKDIRITGLILENINPTLDEISRFTRGKDGEENENNVDLSIIAEASRKAAIAVLQPGDHVEVFEGEQTGVHGHVESIESDIVTLVAEGVDIDGQRIDVPARSVRKRFKPGDHVKVMSGQNIDESGLVVAVADNIVTFWSDLSNREVSVFSKDLRESAEVGASTNIIGDYELHDLVALDPQTVGVIFKTERDTFRVLDQHGNVRVVQPNQISMRRDSNRAIATDADGHELRIKDTVKERDGEQRQGVVLHLHQSFFAFLHNRDIIENGGVFVTRARSVASLAPKADALIKGMAGQDLSKQNPAVGTVTGGAVGSGMLGRGPRDRLIGATVGVIKGPQKGYVGTVKDVDGKMTRVELRSNNKMISIFKSSLKWRKNDGILVPLEEFYASQRSGPGHSGAPSNPGWGGAPSQARTPNPYNSSRTPNPYAGSSTPAWNAGKSPFHSGTDVFGGRTPAAAGRTPNPYASGWGATPAHSSSNGRNDSWGSGGRTPGGAGGRTPAATGGWTSARNTGWGAANSGGWATSPASAGFGGRTPAPSANNSSWGASSNTTTSYGGATPGRQAASAPTPWLDEGLTPGPSAPTPNMWPHSVHAAPTPAAVVTPFEYQTPGTVRPDTTAPTPGAWTEAAFPGRAQVEKEEIGERWLIGLPAADRKGLVVVVRGTTMPPVWHSGEYEAMRGYVLSVMSYEGGLSHSEFTETATLKMMSPPFAGQEKVVPLEYLRPVHASLKEDTYMIAGKWKGRKGKIADSAPGKDMYVLDLGNEYENVPEDHTCLLHS